MMNKRILLLFIGCFFTLISAVGAMPVIHKPLVVGVIQGEPPVSFFYQGKVKGIAYDLLERILKQKKIHFTSRGVTSEAQGLELLQKKKIDILAGAVSPSLTHSADSAYTLPFMLDSVTVATRHSIISFSRLFYEMERTLFWDILLVAFLGQVLFSFLLWLAERRYHREFQKRNTIKGYGFANWAILSAFLRDLIFEPATPLGRVIMGFWLVSSVVFMTVLASSVTVSIVNISSIYHSPIRDQADLRQMRVGVHSHDSLKSLLTRLDVNAQPEINERDLFLKLNNRTYDAIVDNASMLDYYLERHPDTHVGLTGLILRSTYFAYVLRDHDPLVFDLDQGLIRLQSGAESKTVCSIYLNKHIHECAL